MAVTLTVMQFSVIIITYRRPDSLARCLASLVAQTRRAAEIIVVGQGDDSEAGRVVSAAARDAGGPMRWEYIHLDEPNIVAAENAGIARASGDVVAFIDDDAVAGPEWLETFARWYEDPGVGAVGGPNVDYWDGQPTIRRARKVGRLMWYGRFISNHDCLTNGAQEVQFLRGCNMSFRRHLLVEIPTTLLPYWSSFEIFLSGATRERGFRLIFDPAARVDHYPELRRQFVGVYGASKAARERTLTHNDAHNFVYALLSVTPAVQKPFFLVYDFLFGNRRTPGLGRTALLWLAGWRSEAASRSLPSLKGKLLGVRTYLTDGRVRTRGKPPTNGSKVEAWGAT